MPERPGGGDPFRDHLKKVNDVFCDQIRTADRKAAYLFTFMVGFLLVPAEGRDIFSLATYRTAAVRAAMAGVVIFTLFSALAVVLPRRLAGGTSLFWGAWPEQGQRLMSARAERNMHFLFQEYAGNVRSLATIARRKFMLVGMAFRA